MLTSDNWYSKNMVQLEQVNVNLSKVVIYMLCFASVISNVLVGFSSLVVI